MVENQRDGIDVDAAECLRNFHGAKILKAALLPVEHDLSDLSGLKRIHFRQNLTGVRFVHTLEC